MLAAIVALTSAAGWFGTNGLFFWTQPIEAIHGASYSPFRAGQSPFEQTYPTREQVEQDIKIMAEHFEHIRTYGSRGIVGRIVGLADEHDLTVTAGAWLDADLETNDQELDALTRLTSRHDNVRQTVVGNEVLLRKDLSIEQLSDYLGQAREELSIPVSTAETWHNWLDNRELAEHVDFIVVHILPYWEGVPVEHAADYVFRRLREMRAAFPDKRIVLGEVGWPSGGQPFQGATPGASNQEFFFRDFLGRQETRELTYFAMEAFDQPWKEQEGEVGGHWGLFNVDREPKFDFRRASGFLVTAGWQLPAALSTALGAGLALVLALRMDLLRFRGLVVLALGAVLGLSLWVNAATIPSDAALNAPTRFLWYPILGAMALMFVIAGANTMEMAQLLWRDRWLRTFGARPETDDTSLPKVSIHLPACNEPPELVIRSLRSLQQLDYPRFEVLVISNNTTDEALWRPLEAECKRLGERFRFYHLSRCSGAKAGALSFALRQTADDADVIGVVDSDYVVRPDWLRCVVPYMREEKTAIVQAPQDYRQWEGNVFTRMCYWEYQGFFRLGMVYRNEHNAIIQHGTMVLIRRSALRQVGGWAEWCICEDAELGVRLLQAGYGSVYVPESFGRGVVPPSFRGYKLQRARWAHGAAAILRHHWRAFTGFRRDSLSPAQRYHFVAGWLPWLGNSLHLVFTVIVLAWTLGMVVRPSYFPIPYSAVVIPFLIVTVLNFVRIFWLYSRRVPCKTVDRLGAMLAGVSLVYTIGMAFLKGLTGSSRQFMRTPKQARKLSPLSAARDESILLALLLAAMAFILRQNVRTGFDRVVWTIALAAHALPFAASVAVSALCFSSRRRVRDDSPSPSTRKLNAATGTT
ncbi:MAG: glycosyltransferase [bacterium]